MLSAMLRKSGSSLVLTIPAVYAEQNGLKAGSRMSLEIRGGELRLKPLRQRRRLAELLNATPEGLHRVEGWDELSPLGKEL